MNANRCISLVLRVVPALLILAAAPGEVLTAQRTTVTGSVRSSVSEAPIAGATLRITPGGPACVTGGDGTCVLVVRGDSVTIVARAIGFAPTTLVVSTAGEAAAVAVFRLAPSAVRLDEVVAVGTRASDRTVSQSPVPVDVLSRDLLDNTGSLETWQQLQRLVPSVNVPHIPIGDNHVRPVTLRGLAPHHVLVLVNGKRQHPGASLLAGPSVPAASFTDLAAIPTNAIARIEVLRDGASAQYGSDAIGGVVNVVLKAGTHRELQAASGMVLSSEGGRSFTDGEQVQLGGTWGLTARNGARVTLSATLHDRSGTNRAYPDQRPQYFPGNPGNANPPRVSSYLGNGELRSLSTFMNADLPLGRTTELYAFGGVADREGVTPDAFFRRPLDGRTVRSIHPDGFLPEVTSSLTDYSVVAGVRGAQRGWRWDASSGWGENRVGYRVAQSNNVSLGAASPQRFAIGQVAAQQWTGNLDVVRDFRVGQRPANLAIGAAYRLDRFQLAAGEPDSWRDGGVPILDGPAAGQLAPVGAQGLLGFRPIDAGEADRQSGALYAEAEVRPAPRWQVQAAARAESYSDVGSTLDGKFATRLDLGHGLALRGSLSSGFRAPALMQDRFASSRTVFQPVNGVNTVLTVRTFPVGSPEAQLLGATPLRPEQALNQSLGLVLDTPRLPLVTMDVYQVRIDDRIILGGTVTDPSIIRLFDENGLRGIGGGNFFANAIDTRTRGVDLVASHAFLLGQSRVLRVMMGYNRNETVVTRVAPPPAPLAAFGAMLFNRTSRGVIERGQPRETTTLTLSYAADRLAVMVHNQHAGPTAQLDLSNPEADQVVRARWITDARLTYQVRPRVQLAINAANIFDTYPDEWLDFRNGLAATGPSMQGIFRYPGALSPFGMNGRMVNVQVAYR